jgi:syntaxin 16
MAVRSRTQEYEQLRTRFRREVHVTVAASPRGGSLTESTKSQLLADAEQGVGAAAAGGGGQGGLPPVLPPQWVDNVDKIDNDLIKIRKGLDELAKLHNERLKVKFVDNQSAQERQIEILTQEISSYFRDAEQNLKRIAIVGNASGSLPPEERAVRLNVMRAHATEIQELSKQFRARQKDFYMRLKSQEEAGGGFFEDEKGRPLDLDAAMTLEGAMPEEQRRQLEQLEQHASSRQKEILRIVQSVQELSQLFRELNMLIVEQGSVLDRIVYNVERALVKVKEGVVELDKANKESAKMRSIKIIAFLLVICIILMIWLICKRQSC